MKETRERATILRKSGMTYSDIKSRLGVPRSTLSSWFRDQKWSNDIAIECIKKSRNSAAIRLTVLNTVRGSRLKKIYEEARQDALADYSEIKYHPLFIAGVMTYWAHGDKTSRSGISLSSSDPKVIRIFLNFLTSLCGVKKVSVRLILRQDQAEKASILYWSEKSALKPEYFKKTIRIKTKASKNAKKLGVCNVLVNSAYLKSKILRWIDLLAEEIGHEEHIAGIV